MGTKIAPSLAGDVEVDELGAIGEIHAEAPAPCESAGGESSRHAVGACVDLAEGECFEASFWGVVFKAGLCGAPFKRQGEELSQIHRNAATARVTAVAMRSSVSSVSRPGKLLNRNASPPS